MKSPDEIRSEILLQLPTFIRQKMEDDNNYAALVEWFADEIAMTQHTVMQMAEQISKIDTRMAEVDKMVKQVLIEEPAAAGKH